MNYKEAEMNLLVEGIKNNVVIKTDRATKLMVDGISQTYPIYQVRLDQLFFNDKNDRIATWINKYLSDNHVESIDKADREKYNDIIQEFITLSNPERIKQTETNIELIGQQKYGVVLTDGRIIDGNRRFCCLRNISKRNPQFNYFETVILDRDYENNVKQIKMLELQIQIGEEARVDYDPIDKLMGLYRDLVETELLSVKEYAMYTNTSVKDVENELEVAKLLVEFLETINAPGQFYLARELKLDGPLRELQAILKKISDEDRKQLMKCVVFTNFLVKPNDDMTRFTRKIKSIASSRFVDDFLEKETEIAEGVLDSLPDNGQVDSNTISQVRADDEVKKDLDQTMDIFSNKVKVDETKNKPNQVLIKAIDSIEAIDTKVISKLTETQQEEFFDNLDVLIEMLTELKEALNKC